MPIASEPLIQTISFNASPGSCSEIDLSFVPGDGSRRIVIACANVPVSEFPVDAQGYSAGNIFGTGAHLGNGNYVVYNAGGTSTTITGLSGGTEYYFAIFELNGSGSNANYLLSGYLQENEIATGLSISVSSSSGDMCAGDSVQLEVHGAETYDWTPSGSLSSETDSVVWAKPNSTTQYSVEGSENASGCTDTKTLTITVYSLPNVTIGNYSNKCENGNIVTLNSGSPSGGTYSGTGVSGNTFSPENAGVGQHTITYTYVDIHQCSKKATTSILVINSPVVNFSTLNDVCFGASPFVLTGGSPVGGTYSGTGVSGGQFGPALAGIGTHSIRYIFTDGSGCSDTAFTNQVVHALPNVNFAPLQSVCLNNQSFVLTGGTPAGGTYTGTGVSNSQFFPLVSGTGTFLINYNYTDAFGCSDDDTSNIRVHSLPSVSFSNLNPVCQNTGPVVLSGGAPSGGVYSGTGVGGGIFYSGIAGAGQHTITYTYTNSNNCSNSSTEPITVHPKPNPNLGPDRTVCSDVTTNLSGGTFSGYTWSTGEHSQSIEIDTAGYGLGTFAFILNVASSFGCTNKDTILITFDGCNDIANFEINDNRLSIFPNPFTSQFTITTESGSRISLFNISGKLITEIKNAPSVFSLGENLPPGSYFIRMEKKDYVINKLILKN